MRIPFSRQCSQALHRKTWGRQSPVRAIWVFFVLCCINAVAFAQSQSMMTIDQINAAGANQNGLAENIMRGILGGVFDSPFSTTGSGTLFGSIFLYFNMFVFAAATAWGTYGITAGIVQTAHEGVALGRRLNAIWMPIRMVTGIGGLVPVFGGFSLSQAVMILAVGWGINGANFLTNQAVEKMASFTPMVSAPVTNSGRAVSADDLAGALFLQRLCTAGYLKYENQASNLGSPVAPDSKLMDFSSSFKDRAGSADATGSMLGTTEDPLKCLAVGIRRSPSTPWTGMAGMQCCRFAPTRWTMPPSIMELIRDIRALLIR